MVGAYKLTNRTLTWFKYSPVYSCGSCPGLSIKKLKEADLVMDEQEKKTQRPSATIPQTERWILVDSKSNPGRKYYFNPLTKQKLWHHTDEEIKKKEKKINDGSDQTNVAKTVTQFEMFNNNGASTSELRVINTMHPNNDFPWSLPIVQSSIPFIQPNTIPLIQQNLPAALINSQFLSNQIISQPTQAALINLQSGSPTTINQMQNITRFEQNFDINTYQSNKTGTKIKKCAFNHRKDYNSDLRNKLSRKNHTRYINIKRTNAEEINRNVSWDEETVKHILSYLKGYILPSTKQDMWYIVPETNVILKHSRLLTQMTVLDGKCHLKIPPHVRMELKPIEKKPGNEAISRLMRFYWTEADSVIPPENTDSKFSNILNTCRNLTKDNYHVVLLCDTDKAFIDFKKKINIPVFTVNKIKLLHDQGRLIPRNPILSLETITKEPLSEDIQKDSEKASGSTISEQPSPVNVDNVSKSSAKLDSSKSSKRRLIKLKVACEEIPISGNPSKRKRWSALKNKGLDSTSATLQSLSNKDADEMIEKVNQDNTLSQAVDEIDSSIVVNSVSEQKTEHCDAQSSNEAITAVVEKTSISNIHHEKTNSDHEDKYQPPGIPKYLQIMIHVLLKVLHQDPIVIEKEVLQLERLSEAAIGIIKNFTQYGIIVDAANKLSMKIEQSTKGEIEMDQKFSEDMHSYGLNLLKALEVKCSCPADIQHAVKLLENSCDYSTSSVDSCQNILRSVAKDPPQEVTTDNCMKDTDVNVFNESTKPNIEFISGEEGTSDIKRDNDDNCHLNKINLEKTTNREDLFKALKLRKRQIEVAENDNISNICVDVENTEKHVNIERDKGKCLPFDMESKAYSLDNIDENVCNKVFEDNTDSMETECKNIQFSEQIEEFENLPDEDEPKDILRKNNKGKGQFKYFIGMFVKEVREALLVCAQNFELCITQQNDNNDFSRKFGEVHTQLHSIRRSLDSILQRDTSDVNNNFKSLLTKAGVDVEFDQNVCDEYRDVVQNCRIQVDAFLNTLQESLFDQSSDDHLLSPQCV